MHCCEKSDCQDIYCPGRPATVAQVKRRDYDREELPPIVWRRHLKELVRFCLLALLGWLIWVPLFYLVLRA
jgi:hypothetical protein